MTERDEYAPSLEALRREFEYRIRTAVTYGLGRGNHGDSADQDVAGWIEREIGAAMASLTVSQVIEAVPQEEREKAAQIAETASEWETFTAGDGYKSIARHGVPMPKYIAARIREQGKEQGA